MSILGLISYKIYFKVIDIAVNTNMGLKFGLLGPHIKFWWVGSLTHFRNKEISALTRRRKFQKFYYPKISKSLKIHQLELKPVDSIVIIRIIGVYTGDYKDIDIWLSTVRSWCAVNGALRYLVPWVVDKTWKSVVLSWLGSRIQ